VKFIPRSFTITSWGWSTISLAPSEMFVSEEEASVSSLCVFGLDMATGGS